MGRVCHHDLAEQAAAHQPAADQEQQDHRLVGEPGKEGETLVSKRGIGQAAQAGKQFGAQMSGRNLQCRASAQRRQQDSVPGIGVVLAARACA